jgi:Tfp pilus assembly protein PilO
MISKEELLDQYKNMKLSHRLFLVAAVAAIYPLYDTYDKHSVVVEQLDALKAEEEATKTKNEGFKAKISGLPALEEKLGAVREKLEKAKKKLPESIEVDKIITKLGTMEKTNSVVLESFEPKTETQPDKELKYTEHSIAITLRAPFNRVMNYFDEIVHFEELTHLRNISMKVVPKQEPDKVITLQDGRELRELPKKTETEITASAELVLFKSMRQ